MTFIHFSATLAWVTVYTPPLLNWLLRSGSYFEQASRAVGCARCTHCGKKSLVFHGWTHVVHLHLSWRLDRIRRNILSCIRSRHPCWLMKSCLSSHFHESRALVSQQGGNPDPLTTRGIASIGTQSDFAMFQLLKI